MTSATSSEVRALLLAAGEGSRLRPHSDGIAKPMITLGGKPILEHNLELLVKHGIRTIAINLHYCPESVTNHFGDGRDRGASITYSYEPELLGTAGAVKKIGPDFFSGTFLVVYGDNWIDCDLTRFISFHKSHRGIATVCLHFRDDVRSSGLVKFDDDHRITSFLEKPKSAEPISGWVNAGIVAFEPSVLSYIPPEGWSDFGQNVFPALLSAGERLYAYQMRDNEGIKWIDTPEDLARVRSEINGKQEPALQAS